MNDLEKFKKDSKKLEKFCSEISQITQSCIDKGLLEQEFSLSPKITKISQQLQSKVFRVAIVGEFSKGKSTLLNALVRKEIQPVRDIPCNGTITILRHGSRQRIICHYKDGKKEEISLEQYRQKVTIPVEAAIYSSFSDHLFQSDIEEIIFEDSDLDLCKNGVEIIDSPGLNEHPEQEKITKKLLKNTDAVIFLTNGKQALTQSERESLSDIRDNLNGGSRNQPAENLFVVVNFWDLVSKDGSDFVEKRVQNLLFQGDHPIIPIIDESNRIHFISAKLALEAFLKKQSTLESLFKRTENEYTKSFNKFVKSLEHFLAKERGKIKISRDVSSIQNLIEECEKQMDQSNAVLDQSIQDINKKYEDAIKEILDKQAKASDSSRRIKDYVNSRRGEITRSVKKSWDSWTNGLKPILEKKRDQWSSKHSPILSRDQLIEDYIKQFREDLSSELDDWTENQLKKDVLVSYLEEIDSYIKRELNVIESDFKEIIVDKNWSISSNNIQKPGFFRYIGLAGLGGGAFIRAILLPVPVILAIIAGAIGAILALFGTVLALSMKEDIFEQVWTEFVKSSDTIFTAIDDTINRSLSERVEWADEVISNVMSDYDRLLEQQEETYKNELALQEQHKAFITEKRHELEKLRDRLKSLINELEI